MARQQLSSAEKILKSATRLFVKKGYKGTSVAEIMKAAGLTSGALYCHFNTKEDLTRHIISLFEEKYLKNMKAFIENAGGSPLEKIENMLRFDIHFAGENPELCLFMTIISAEMIGSGGRLGTHLKKSYQQWRDFVSDILEQGKQSGELKDTMDPRLLALVIMGVHDGVLLHFRMNRGLIDVKSYTAHFRNLIMSGVKGWQSD
jgi:AcrR family transcriptional regulator